MSANRVIVFNSNEFEYLPILDNVPLVRLSSDHESSNAEYYVCVYDGADLLFTANIVTAHESIPPNCIVSKTAVFIGFDDRVCIFKYNGEPIMTYEMSTFFCEFLCYLDVIVCIFEADILFLSEHGQFIEHKTVSDIIVKTNIDNEGNINLQLFEGDTVKLDIPKVVN